MNLYPDNRGIENLTTAIQIRPTQIFHRVWKVLDPVRVSAIILFIRFELFWRSFDGLTTQIVRSRIG